MPVDAINLHRLLTNVLHRDSPVAFHGGKFYQADEFCAAVSYWSNRFKVEPNQRYALFTEAAYPFAVLLFALFQAGKDAWIPGNNRPGTAQLLQDFGCQLIGDWDDGSAFNYHLETTVNQGSPFAELNPDESRVVLFTSGSTGEPKPIVKTVKQLEIEIATLENMWGKQLMKADVLSTVSHQHIYGLLFRILWPLAAGRCFHSTTYLNPELLINHINTKSAYWVASPAHLKRLDAESPWQAIAKLKAIFSSGGALPDVARQQISQAGNQQVIEIYGSTETGGIAWKMQAEAWTLFPGLSLSINENRYYLESPYLDVNQDYPLDDQITMLDDGRFTLNGRADRIVKIEEKRLSLTELEQRLADNSLVQDAYGLVLSQHRDTVCVAVELTDLGWQTLLTQGRKQVIGQLRLALQPWFEAVLMPRKWLFVNMMPLTAQGKINRQLLSALLGINKHKLPSVQDYEATADTIKLGIKVPHVHELIYFPDHFAAYPILPGVVQLAWVEHFGRLLFGVGSVKWPFSHLEAIKFLKVIRPGIELILTLNWLAQPSELQFNFSDGSETYSSGRMVYKSSVKVK
ncbi:hypothetical protein MCAMS1_02153 [biofilm metagenome]